MSAETPKKTAAEVAAGKNLSGKVILITGGYTGLGAESTRVLLGTGATVVVAGRTQSKIDAFVEKHQVDGRLHGALVDLGDLTTVKPFAAEIKAKHGRVDILMNNAGIMNCAPGETKQGFELQVGTNGLGTVAVTEAILPLIPDGGRVINLSSYGHRWLPYNRAWDKESVKLNKEEYRGFRAYQQSKLANILHTKALAKARPAVKSVSLHPGVIHETELGRGGYEMERVAEEFKENMELVGARGGMSTLAEGAATQVLLAVADDKDLPNGSYWLLCKEWEPSQHAQDAAQAEAFYKQAKELTASYV